MKVFLFTTETLLELFKILLYPITFVVDIR